MNKEGYLIINSGIPCGSRPPDHVPSLIGTNEEPWITRKAIEFLYHNLTPDMEVLEYGTGSSTIWFAQRTQRIIAVEHYLEWVDYVRSLLPSDLESKVEIVHVPNSDTGNTIGGDGKYYDDYVDYVKTTESSFDLISIDGRGRRQCVINAINKVKKNGFLLVDNSEREAYQPGLREIPSHWEKNEFPTYLGTTTIYKHI